MKILCSNCKTPNPIDQEKCLSCAAVLVKDFSSQLQTEDGQILSIVNLFTKVQQLEKRVTFVEQNQSNVNQPKPVAIAKKVVQKPIEEKIASPVFVVPKRLPDSIPELQALLKKVVQAKIEAKEAADMALHADLSFDGKKIARKITRLQELEQQEREVVEQSIAPTPKEEEKEVTISDLKDNLRALKEELQIAESANDFAKKAVVESQIRSINRQIKNQELAALYGKHDQNDLHEEVPAADKIQEKVINKHLVFQIEQEISALWAAKKKAQLKQDIVRLAIYSDKETKLKKELELAKNGEIQERLVSQPTLQTNTSKTTSSTQQQAAKKAQPKPKPKPKKEGPSAVEQFFAPLVSAIAFLEQKYSQSKKEGKLPMFFLVVAGIAALLFGFGFLAQYSATTYFSDYLTQLKVGFGFVCSTAAMGIGIKLHKRDKKFEEFGAALIGLGLSLNYLFIYYLSEDLLVSSGIGFVLILVNTALAVGLAITYASRIIALLALLGGAFAPSYLHSTGENTHIYFAYLWLLCASSAVVAHRLKFGVLNLVSFGLATLILGQSTYFNYTSVQQLSDGVYLLLFHAFGYLYAYVSLFDFTKPKKEQTLFTLITLVGGQIAMMSSLYFVYGHHYEHYNTLALAYLLNTLPFAGILAAFWSQWTEKQRALLVGIISGFVAAAIPAYFGIAYRGLLWATQGIVLLAAGLIYKMPIVRRISYSAIIGGIITMLINLEWDAMPDRDAGRLFTTGYINLWSLGIVLIIISILFKKYEDSLIHHEKKVPVVFNELISIWGIFAFYITTYYFFGDYAFNLALIPMFVLLVWNNYRKLYLAEILGLGQILVLVAVVFKSIDYVSSTHFLDQTLYGKIAIIEILAVLWVLPLFYKKVLADAPEYKHKLAEKARLACYMIAPLFILDIVTDVWNDYIIYGLWAVAIVTFGLAEWTKEKILSVEFLIFTFAAAVVSAVDINYGALALGNAFLLGLAFYKKAWKEEAFQEKIYQPLFFFIPYYALFSIVLVWFKLSNEDVFSALLLASALLITVLNLGSKLAPIKKSAKVAYPLVWVLAFAGLFFSLSQSYTPSNSLGWTSLLVVLGWLFKKVYLGDKGQIQWVTESIAVHILAIASYSAFLFQLTNDLTSLWLTIVLFLHGIALVFNGLQPAFKHYTKLYIGIFVIALGKLFLVDMKDSETVMKIIVFIIVGVVCLVAAFFLIKQNDKNRAVDNSILDENIEKEDTEDDIEELDPPTDVD